MEENRKATRHYNYPMNVENVRYWMALKSVDGIGNGTFQSLLACFRSPAGVFAASIHDLTAVPGLSKDSAAAIKSFKDWDKIHRQIDILDRAGIKVITCLDETYPENLLNIYDRPAFLYVLGTLSKEDIAVAIVGSRHASVYGKYTTDRISRELALRGITIVSGMARGIDSCAHRGALAAKGRTIAVLGSGLDVIYPPENKKLFAAIAENGAVMSEFPLGTKPLSYHFPARNRIISGLSYGVVVVEAGEKSGSLITARLAMEQGREVFAIPGTIDSAASRGTNSLIKQGAKLIDNIDDILEDIIPQLSRSLVQLRMRNEREPAADSRSPNPEKDLHQLSPVDRTILTILACGKKHVDDIIAGAGLPPANVLSALMNLELSGMISQHPGKFFSRTE